MQLEKTFCLVIMKTNSLSGFWRPLFKTVLSDPFVTITQRAPSIKSFTQIIEEGHLVITILCSAH